MRAPLVHRCRAGVKPRSKPKPVLALSLAQRQPGRTGPLAAAHAPVAGADAQAVPVSLPSWPHAALNPGSKVPAKPQDQLRVQAAAGPRRLVTPTGACPCSPCSRGAEIRFLSLPACQPAPGLSPLKTQPPEGKCTITKLRPARGWWWERPWSRRHWKPSAGWDSSDSPVLP